MGRKRIKTLTMGGTVYDLVSLGMPEGGIAGQVLQKVDGTDFNTAWATIVNNAGTKYDSTTQSILAATELTSEAGYAAGNARGKGATDLQMYRRNATHVASGSYAVAIGYSNAAAADYAITVGALNTAVGAGSAVFGVANTSTGEGNTVGGFSNTSSTSYNAIFGEHNQSGGLSAALIAGSCNIGQTNTLFELGNGTWNSTTSTATRSNAFEVLNTGIAYLYPNGSQQQVIVKNDYATTSNAGVVKVDGTSVRATEDGVISAEPMINMYVEAPSTLVLEVSAASTCQIVVEDGDTLAFYTNR